MMLRHPFLLISLLLLTQISLGQNTVRWHGFVEDSASGKPISYVRVSVEGENISTLTNDYGYFRLVIPASLSEKALLFNHLNYQAARIIPEGDGKIKIRLAERAFELEAVVIRPQEPTDYLRQAVRKIPINYPESPFQTQAYYRSMMTENQQPIELTESVFKSYYPSIVDTAQKGQHQLLLYRRSDDLQELQFLKERQEKKFQKKVRKAEKKGEAPPERDEADRVVQANFGSPSNILGMHIGQNLPACLDTNQFKKFRFEFGPEVNYGEHKLIAIHFNSKRKVKMTGVDGAKIKQNGTVYLDAKTDAIVALDAKSKIIIPAIIRPILLLAGYGLSNPDLVQELRYQSVGRKWYPEYFHVNVGLRIKRNSMFGKDEEAKMIIDQIFKADQIATSNIQQIAKEKRFDADEEMEKQVHPETGVNWSTVPTMSVFQTDEGE
ncbi:MAG: carboxypeptidase-like regulatory domain-containing protein [Bacteroidota bacterium]